MIFAGRKVVLASASPRRLAILRQIGVEPQVMPVDVDEIKVLAPGDDPEQLVTKNATMKAQAAAAGCEDAIVLGSGTVVVLEGEIFGKPADETEAAGMLSLLSGREHQVYTGVCLIDTKTGRSISGADTCRVKFSPLSGEDIEEYVATGEPMGKAGAYGIQGRGALLIDKIDGDYYTVMGLSVAMLRRLAKVMEKLDRSKFIFYCRKIMT